MVVYAKQIDPKRLDLGYLALFLGQRVNELVVERLIRAEFRHVRESHGYVIQHLIDGERSITELAQCMGVTQQAASKTVAEMVRLGILESKTAADKRAKVIRISERGWESIYVSRRARAVIDRKLARIVGDEPYGRMKLELIECLTQLGGTERIRSRRVREPH
ncbi:MAG: MarR family transcriptional regulator [Terracidiphilus sp.]